MECFDGVIIERLKDKVLINNKEYDYPEYCPCCYTLKDFPYAVCTFEGPIHGCPKVLYPDYLQCKHILNKENEYHVCQRLFNTIQPKEVIEQIEEQSNLKK